MSDKACSPLIHSAFTSTGLPKRGVTGWPSTRASIHVSAQPSAPCVMSPSPSTLMPKRVPARWCSTMPLTAGASVVSEIGVAGDGHVPAERVEEPRRGVDGVVFEAAGVGGVGEHPLAERGGHAFEQLAAFVVPIRAEEQAFVRRERVA